MVTWQRTGGAMAASGTGEYDTAHTDKLQASDRRGSLPRPRSAAEVRGGTGPVLHHVRGRRGLRRRGSATSVMPSSSSDERAANGEKFCGG